MSWSELYPELFNAEGKFKEQGSFDIKATFLDLGEFAEQHEINGVSYTCIVQQVSSNDELTINRNSDYYPGLYGNVKTINIAKDDLPEVPVYSQRIWLDGDIFTVESVADDMGLLTVIVVGDSR